MKIAILSKSIVTDSDKDYYSTSRVNILNRRFTEYRLFGLRIYYKEELFIDTTPKTKKKKNENTYNNTADSR